MPKYENAKLISMVTGEEIKPGTVVKLRRGEAKFLYVSRLPEGNSSGRVMTDEEFGGEYFPSVLDGKIQPPIEESEAGCWLDGNQGWNNTWRVIERAENYGFKVSDEDRALIEKYKETSGTDEDAHEVISGQGELSDKATEWLEELAPNGFTFVWDAGELSLMTDEEAELFQG